MSDQHFQRNNWSITQSVFNRQEHPKNPSQYKISKYWSRISPWPQGLLLGVLTTGLILAIVTTLWLTERKTGANTMITVTTATSVTNRPTGIYALTIPTCATWDSIGITVAGDPNGTSGSTLALLKGPVGIFVNNDDTLFIADRDNHRVMRYKANSISGEVVAGNGTAGSSAYQLNQAKGVATDQSGAVIVADSLNYRIQKFISGSLLGITLFSNSSSNPLGHTRSLYIDFSNNIYVTDSDFHQCIKYSPHLATRIVLAGGGTNGPANNQLADPYGAFVDQNNTLYVADSANHRVMKYVNGATIGVLVAGTSAVGGSGLNELQGPGGVIVDNNGYIYVADTGNDRIMKWTTNYLAGGVCLVGCTGSSGPAPNQFSGPRDLKFDQYGNLYVSDQRNNRVQKFMIQRPISCPIRGG